MEDSIEQKIFAGRSTTYFLSAKLFPADVQKDVAKLYSFLRVADDYVDQETPDKTAFDKLRLTSLSVLNGKQPTNFGAHNDTDAAVIENLVFVYRKYGFEYEWMELFFNSMQADLDNKRYKTLEDSLQYVHGSAEVVGLMMAKLMGLPEESFGYARLQGRAMQWINFIRDLDEDNQLGRQYFPESDLKKFGLPNLLIDTAQAQPKQLTDFIRFQVKRYQKWQAEAQLGLKFIDYPKRRAVEKAITQYNKTAEQIKAAPLSVFSGER